jgi:60 kDa SS-A/Ro ribonucleoprotein
MVPTEQLASADVWHALLHAGKHGMPLGALVRNLGKMTSTGLLSIGSDAARFVVEKLADARAIEKARLHPMSLLIAQRVYASGHGDKGKLAWHPVASIVDALDRAFYLAFRAVTATHKRHLLALDVSGSMASGRVAGSPLSPREASAAMALVTANVEDNTAFTAFTDKLVSLDLSARMSLRDAVAKVSGLRFGATDCAQPMLYALEKKLNVDVFVVYTDSETWAGKVKPHDALTRYREATGINAKLVVVGMVSNGFSIADPNDAGMLDVVGFSTETPQALAAFVNE